MTSKDSVITFDTTTLLKLVEEPLWVLENEEQFWSTYRAQKLVRKWADHVNFEIPYQKWRDSVGEWSKLSSEDRKNHLLVKMSDRILSAASEFQSNVLLHNCNFIPPEFNLSVTVQFTAFVPPFAFAMEDLVIDVASKYWKNNPEHILNLLMHEVFHVAYSWYRTLHDEKERVHPDIYKILDNIVNEGICTYVGYKALPIYPVEQERDYILLDDDSQTDLKFKETTEVLSSFGKISPEDLQKLSWNKGVVERAYYVTGATIARTIDETLGRNALIDVYSKGPVSIVELYNTVAPPERKLFIPS